MPAKIESIRVSVGKCKLDLTLEEARELSQELQKLLGAAPVTIIRETVDRTPYWQPVYSDRTIPPPVWLPNFTC